MKLKLYGFSNVGADTEDVNMREIQESKYFKDERDIIKLQKILVILIINILRKQVSRTKIVFKESNDLHCFT